MIFNEVVLEAADPETLGSFYKSILQLPVTKNPAGDLEIVCGKSLLIFKKSESQPFYHIAFNIPANKLQDAKNIVSKRTPLTWLEEYNSYIADFKNWNARSIYFNDPAGNILELICRLDLCDEEKSKKKDDLHIRCISEVGLVLPAAQFDDKVKTIKTDFGLQDFPKQPPMEHFRALGDDHGLFIVVPDSRVWFASLKPAGQFPIHIKFENAGGSYVLNSELVRQSRKSSR